MRQQNGTTEQAFAVDPAEGSTLLFSGGLDSLAAAVEYGRTTPLQLVSHVTHNQETRSTQVDLVTLLRQSGISLCHEQFFISSRDAQNFDHDVESTQRTRSFLFLVLGALAARRRGHSKVLMIAENGQLAIHLPLNSARVGAFSTHTAHPDVIALMQQILRAALAVEFEIVNPFLYRTKSEVIDKVWKDLRTGIAVSSSCWKNARLRNNATHCGECIPCYVRRVAIEVHGNDPTAYARDVFAENIGALAPDDEGRRNLVDLCEFSMRFSRQSEIELMTEWPELYSENINREGVIGMYRRAAEQTVQVLTRYQGVAPLIQ
jgi:7-cyano-7-deazaguanine synthase in queuosine biosynthesis